MHAIPTQPLLLRSLRLIWWVALLATLAAAAMVAAPRFLPEPPPLGTSSEPAAGPAPAQVIAALSAGNRAGMIEELRSISRLVEAGGDARSRLDALVAREEKAAAENPPAIILTALASRLDHAIEGLRDTSRSHSAAPPGGLPRAFETAGTALALLAALLALVATPLALAPGLAWREVLASGGSPDWGAERKDLWGGLSRLMQLRNHQGRQEAAAGDRIRGFATEIEGTLRDTGTEALKLRAELARTAGALQSASQASETLAERTTSAVRTLEESTGQIDDAIGTLSALPSLLAAPVEGLMEASRRAGEATQGMGQGTGSGALERFERALPMLIEAMQRIAPTDPDELASRVAEALVPPIASVLERAQDAQPQGRPVEIADGSADELAARLVEALAPLLTAPRDRAQDAADDGAQAETEASRVAFALLPLLRQEFEVAPPEDPAEVASRIAEALLPRLILELAQGPGVSAPDGAADDAGADAAAAAGLPPAASLEAVAQAVLEALASRPEPVYTANQAMALAEALVPLLEPVLRSLAPHPLADIGARVADELMPMLSELSTHDAEHLSELSAVFARLESRVEALAGLHETAHPDGGPGPDPMVASVAAIEAELGRILPALDRLEAEVKANAPPISAPPVSLPTQDPRQALLELEARLEGTFARLLAQEPAAAPQEDERAALQARLAEAVSRLEVLPEAGRAVLTEAAAALDASLQRVPEASVRIEQSIAGLEALAAEQRGAKDATVPTAQSLAAIETRLDLLQTRIDAVPEATRTLLDPKLDLPLGALLEATTRLDSLPQAVEEALAAASDALDERLSHLPELRLSELGEALASTTERIGSLPEAVGRALAEAGAALDERFAGLPALEARLAAQADRFASLQAGANAAYGHAAAALDTQSGRLAKVAARLDSSLDAIPTWLDAGLGRLDAALQPLVPLHAQLEAHSARLGALPGRVGAALEKAADAIDASLAPLPGLQERIDAQTALLRSLPASGEAALAQANDRLTEALAPLPAWGERLDAACARLEPLSDTTRNGFDQAAETIARSLAPLPELVARLSEAQLRLDALPAETRAETQAAIETASRDALAALAPLADQLQSLVPAVGDALRPATRAAERVDQAAERVASVLSGLPARIDAAVAEAARSVAVSPALERLPAELKRAVGDGVEAIRTEAQAVGALAQEGTRSLVPLREVEARIVALTHAAEASIRSARLEQVRVEQSRHELGRADAEPRPHPRGASEPVPSWSGLARPAATPRSGWSVDVPAEEPVQASVARSILAELGLAEPGVPERNQEDAGSVGLETALRQLDGVETAVLRLTREAEDMAEQIASGGGTALPAALRDRAPELLGSLDDTITRLRSVATALALACDASDPAD